MSRGVRDLRDLICVSRLTFHESEEEDIFSDYDGTLSNEKSFSCTSSQSDNSKSDSPLDSTDVVSPDSGCITESPVTSTSQSASVDRFENEDNLFMTGLQNKIKDTKLSLSLDNAKLIKNPRKKKKKSNISHKPMRHDLPKPAPLPPVQSSPSKLSKLGEHKLDINQSKTVTAPSQNHQPSKVKTRIHFDDILTFMDATIVANWLKRSNEAIQELAKFCNSGENFIQFAHFWLSDFPDFQKKDIFSMEYDILLDEIELALVVGRESKQVERRDILDMTGAVFKEYPVRLMGSQGPHMFLDYLEILTSGKHDQYKKLLSDVRCSTSNRQYAQWLLATRSFALVNVWSSVVNFYRNLLGVVTSQDKSSSDQGSSKELSHKRIVQSLRLGLTDVVNYFLVSGHVKSTYLDPHRKSLLFLAVMYTQPEVVKYLLTKVNPAIDVNQAADNGNTALHAAVNSGSLTIVSMLCESDSLNVNCVNKQCDGATPLHLAVMHGHTDIVDCLLKHNSNPLLKMADKTAVELARDFNQSEILNILENKLGVITVKEI
ncbi:unnamed protein product [Lymnaea stagnalis]|uniref:SIPAR domain-containing protein n=1 Tax=Lymnaea stagnalis TaxID=6523 RepID=A0AAV2IJF3_LYMST